MFARHGNVGCIVTRSRSNSSVLTAFQAKVRGLIGQLGKDHDFALTGGADSFETPCQRINLLYQPSRICCLPSR